MNHRDTESTEEHRVVVPRPADPLRVSPGEKSSRTDRKRSDSVRVSSGPRAVARACQAARAPLGRPLCFPCLEGVEW